MRPFFVSLREGVPEGGTYSRVGACPYLLEPIYEPRPCKGLISRILLRGKPRQRYAPLTGAAARIDEHWREIGASPYPKYEPLSGAAAPQPPCYLVKNRAEISLNFAPHLSTPPSPLYQSYFSGFSPYLLPPKTYANTTHPPSAAPHPQPLLVCLLPVGARRAHRAQPRHDNKHRFQQFQQQMAGGCHQSRHQRP